MTDITELALITIKNQIKSFDTVVLRENEALALVEALEKAQQRIVELDRKNCELDSLTQRWAVERAENADRIAELESRTVKLPDLRQIVSGDRYVWSDGVYNYSQDVKVVLAAAGIKVEAE